MVTRAKPVRSAGWRRRCPSCGVAASSSEFERRTGDGWPLACRRCGHVAAATSFRILR
jgi:hypothetical protein